MKTPKHKEVTFMKMSGIIFSNIYDTPMGSLTKKRTVASMPFGGRYRFIDFALSNMVNSGIWSIGVITKYNYQSLMDHIGGAGEWDLNRKDAVLRILPPFVTGMTTVYRGNLEALSNALSFLNGAKPDYVVICDTTVICNIDLKKALKSHVASGKDVTIIANRAIADFERDSTDLYISQEDGRVTDMAIGYTKNPNALVGMGMFIISRKLLTEVIKTEVSRGRYSFERDFLLTSFLNKSIEINTYEFKHTVLRNHNVASYFKNSFRKMVEDIKNDIFKRDALIRTKVRDDTPTLCRSGCNIKNCIVADGCDIRGSVENSVLFRGVVIEKGAKVQNSVIMQDTVICEGATVNYAITDKNVTLSPNTVISGAPMYPVIVDKNEIVGE